MLLAAVWEGTTYLGDVDFFGAVSPNTPKSKSRLMLAWLGCARPAFTHVDQSLGHVE